MLRTYRDYKDYVFHKESTSAKNGYKVDVRGFSSLLIETSGTSTSRTIAFKGAYVDGTFRAISCQKLSDRTFASTTTGIGELWRMDTGLNHVIIDLTAVAGGNVTIKGRAVE